MTRLSGRLALPALAILLLGASPGWLQGDAHRASDCRDVESLTAVPGPAPHPDIRWTPQVLHTYAPLEVYWRPAGDPIQSTYPEHRVGMRELEVDGVRLPVHWSFDEGPKAVRVRAYFYVHDGRPVAHPAWSGLRLAPRQLRDGILPVTLMLLDGLAIENARPELEPRTIAWLENAWRHHRSSCAP